MFQFRVLFRCLLLGLLLSLLVVLPVLADSPLYQQFGRARLTLSDLPPGFETTAGTQVENNLAFFTSLWTPFLDAGSEARLINLDAFKSGSPEEEQWVISGLIAPLSSSEQESLQALFSDPTLLIEGMKLVTGEELFLSERTTERDLELVGTRACGNDYVVMEYVAVYQGEVLELVAYFHPSQDDVKTSAFDLARRLDHRVGMVVAASQGPFRLPGPLVPRFTTYIPTPLEMSSDTGVIFTNIGLAGVIVIIFAVAAEAFSQVLDDRNMHLWFAWMSRLRIKIGDSLKKLFERRPRLLEPLRFIVVLLFYGLVFFFIEPERELFSLEGFFLLFSMILAFAVVGLLDDYRCLYIIKREKWPVQATLEITPKNFLLSLASAALNIALRLNPGLFFGSPEVLEEIEMLDENQKKRLLGIRAQVLIVLSLSCYLFTILTHWMQGAAFSGTLADLAGAVEAVFLTISAVALENFFVQLIGFPKTLGQALQQHHLWWRWPALFLTGLAFFHVLINPRGDLGDAVQDVNVRLTLVVALAFSVAALMVWFYLYYRKREGRKPMRWPLAGILSGGVVLTAFVLLFVPYNPETQLQVELPPAETAYSASGPLDLPDDWTEQRDVQSGLPDAAAWPLVWQEGFLGNESGWETGLTEDDWATVNYQLAHGLYRLEITPKVGELILFSETPAPAAGDFYFAVDVHQFTCPGDAEIGLLFRFASAESFYYLGINSDRELWAQVHHAGGWENLLAGVEAVTFQPCAWNRIAVSAWGSDFQVFINDQPATAFSDSRISSGSFALGSWFARPGETAVFEYDNFELRTP